MIDIVNKTYTVLRYLEDLAAESGELGRMSPRILAKTSPAAKPRAHWRGRSARANDPSVALTLDDDGMVGYVDHSGELCGVVGMHGPGDVPPGCRADDLYGFAVVAVELGSGFGECRVVEFQQPLAP